MKRSHLYFLKHLLHIPTCIKLSRLVVGRVTRIAHTLCTVLTFSNDEGPSTYLVRLLARISRCKSVIDRSLFIALLFNDPK